MKSWYGHHNSLNTARFKFILSRLIHLKALPEDLKTKLSLDEDLVSSPREALSRASADRIAWRHKHLKRCSILYHSADFCACRCSQPSNSYHSVIFYFSCISVICFSYWSRITIMSKSCTLPFLENVAWFWSHCVCDPVGVSNT